MDQGLVDQVAGLNVGEQQDVGMAGGRTVLGALVPCGFGVDGDVHGQGAVHHAAGDLALGVHLAQLVRVHGAGHLGVDHFDSGQRRDLGALHAAGMGHGHGVLDDVDLVLQGGVGHKGHVAQEQQLLDALDLKYGHMGQGLAGAQAHFLVQHALQEGLGVQQALHVHIGHAVVGQLDGGQRSLDLVGLVDDLVAGQVDGKLRGDLADGGFVAHQDGVRDALLAGRVNGFQNGVVLSGGHGQLLLAAGFYFCDQVLKIHGTAPRLCFL